MTQSRDIQLVCNIDNTGGFTREIFLNVQNSPDVNFFRTKPRDTSGDWEILNNPGSFAKTTQMQTNYPDQLHLELCEVSHQAMRRHDDKNQFIQNNMQPGSARVLMWVSRSSPGFGHISMIMRMGYGVKGDLAHLHEVPESHESSCCECGINCCCDCSTDRATPVAGTYEYISMGHEEEKDCIDKICGILFCLEPTFSSYDNDLTNSAGARGRNTHPDYVIDIQHLNMKKMFQRYYELRGINKVGDTDLTDLIEDHSKVQPPLKWRMLSSLCCVLPVCWNGLMKYICFCCAVESCLRPRYFNCTTFVNDLLKTGGLYEKLKYDDSRIPFISNLTFDFGARLCGENCMSQSIKNMTLWLTWYLSDAPNLFSWFCGAVIKFGIGFSAMFGLVALTDYALYDGHLNKVEKAEWALFISSILVCIVYFYKALRDLGAQNDTFIPSRMKSMLENAAVKTHPDISFYSANRERLESTLVACYADEKGEEKSDDNNSVFMIGRNDSLA